MKLLLTSAGLTNKVISDKLFELVGKPPDTTTVAFIPTAMNPELGDKRWFVDNLNEFVGARVKEIDIVEIALLEKKDWLPRIERADVLCFSGGDAVFLMYHLHMSGLAELLPALLQNKVYMGISAGSMVAGTSILLSKEDYALYYDREPLDARTSPSLKFVPFNFRPHYNSADFTNVRADTIQRLADLSEDPIYAADDQSALAIVDGKVERVGEGAIEIFTKN